MNESDFWALISRIHNAANGDMGEKCEQLKSTLGNLPPEDAKGFLRTFDTMMGKSYTWSLWGAAYVLNGGCSDDAFMDFRSSLISRGEEQYLIGLNAPDDLAAEPFDEESWFYEGFQHAVSEGVEASAGELPSRHENHPSEPLGDEWDEDSLEQLFPKLFFAAEQRFSASEPSAQDLNNGPRKSPWWKFW